MPADAVPVSLTAALVALAQCLDDAKIPAVIVGGVAASLLGRPRLTRDIDALVELPEDRWIHFLERARSFGIEPRIEDSLNFARDKRVLLMRHLASEIDVDVILSGLPFEREAIATAEPRQVAGFMIRLPRVEDLMILKAVAQRPRDIQDLESLLDAHPQADLTRVRQWVREFSTAASMPNLLSGFDRLVVESRSRRG